MWVANAASNRLTELSASTGALVKVLTGSSYQFNGPDAVDSDGTHVWVVNSHGNSVTELSASTGAPVMVLTGPTYQFYAPDAIAADGANVWVTNVDQSVTGFPAS